MQQRLTTFTLRLFLAALFVLMSASSSQSRASAEDDRTCDNAEVGAFFFRPEDVCFFEDCGQFWPSTGRFQTYTDGYEYSAYLYFQLTQEEKDALLCVDDFLEIDFRILGFDDPTEWPLGWEDYSVHTNIPGGIHDTAAGDEKDPTQGMNPAVTGIVVSGLQVGYEYFAGIEFSGLALLAEDALGPRVSFEWQVSHWVRSQQEIDYCTSGGMLGTRKEWCIFSTVSVFLSHGYTTREYGEKQSLIFDGFRFWEFGTAGSPELAEMDIGAFGPNGHEIGARFTVTPEDGTLLGSCTLVGDAAAPYPVSCQVSVPLNTIVVVTLDVGTITPGYAPVENPIGFDTSPDPGAASHWGVFFQIEPEESPSSG